MIGGKDTMVAGRAWHAAAATLRLYLRHWPGAFAKQWLWDRVARRYIIWRSLPIVAHTRFGMRLHGAFPDLVHAYVYFFGLWEPAITAIYRAGLRRGDTVIDIGANVGVHTLLAAALVGPEGEVHAIEASPGIFARLQRNLAANDASQVVARNIAVTDRAGLVPVFLHDATNLGGTTILATEAEAGAVREAMVRGAPLGEILPPEVIRRARLIKIDVEGAEWLVLQGMRDLLPLLAPQAEVLVEVNVAAMAALGGSVPALVAMFAEAGFAGFEIANPYRADFYARPPPLDLRPLRPWLDAGTHDLVFRRSAAA